MNRRPASREPSAIPRRAFLTTCVLGVPAVIRGGGRVAASPWREPVVSFSTSERSMPDQTRYSFDVEIDRERSRMNVRFTVRAPAGLDLAVTNRLYQVTLDGSPDFGPDGCHLFVDGTELHVSKLYKRSDYDCGYVNPIVGSYVPRGSTLIDAITIPLPVEALGREARADRGFLRLATRLTLAIGYLPLGDEAQLVAPIRAWPGLWNVLQRDDLVQHRPLTAAFNLAEPLQAFEVPLVG
jgi:hypothetical protein